MTTAAHPSLSVIIPIGSRRADIGSLYREYKAGVAAVGAPYEFIFVLDGPRMAVRSAVEDLQRAGEEITIVNLTRSFGEAAALMAGFERARGATVLTLPAYHQIDAADIPLLVAELAQSDMAVAYRSPRRGNLFDRLRRSAFHGLVSFVTGTALRDLGCGARAMRREVLDEIDLYGDQHRFLAILAAHLGFRVNEVPLRQSAHDRAMRAYRPREYVHHLLDLFSILFLVRFTKKPLRFFGMLGAATFSIGALVIAWLASERILFNQPLADRPALLLAALLVVLGMQVFALGLLGELIIFTHAKGLKDYRVERVIHYPEHCPDNAAASAAGDSSPADEKALQAEAQPPSERIVTA
jgi:glycosyltransferase involved in cell wall biosynthesis